MCPATIILVAQYRIRKPERDGARHGSPKISAEIYGRPESYTAMPEPCYNVN